MSDLQRSIVQTLNFFDLFGQPLTAPEVHRFLYCPPSGTTFESVLQELEQGLVVNKIDGVYVLKNGQATMQTRTTHTRLYIQKMKRARSAIYLMQYIPFVQSVFVCNTVGFGVPTEKSDIDVLIISKEKTIFLTRFLVTLLLTLAGFRRHGKQVQNRICLSFYLTKNALSLRSIAIERDIYLSYWLALLIPIYDPFSLHAKLLEENKWVKDTLPFAFTSYVPAKHIKVSRNFISKILNSLFSWRIFISLWKVGELLAKRLQLWWMREKLERQREIKTAVIVSDTMLKFHEEDRRVFYRDEWEDKCKMQN